MVFDAGEPRGLWDWYSRAPEVALAEAQRWAGNPRISDQAVVNYWLRSRRVSWAPLPAGFARFPYREGIVAWEPPVGTRLVHMYGKATNPGNPEVRAANPWIVNHWR
jgi:hypothetical protein